MALMPLIDKRQATPNQPRFRVAPKTTAAGRAIGILGGSFNPAHGGHRYLSREALKRLGLDEVWWLVSPQNPLKSRSGMAPFDVRLARARDVAGGGRIRVTDLEHRFGSAFTNDTLERLKQRRGERFVFLIGADNLVQLPRWRHWKRIVEAVPIAVFDRAPILMRRVGRRLRGRLKRGACRRPRRFHSKI